MSIGATRKVSNSTSATKAPASAGATKSFVEQIDTTNNVLVKDDAQGEGRKNNQQFAQNEPQEKNIEAQIPINIGNNVGVLNNSEAINYEIHNNSIMNKNIRIYDKNQQDITNTKASLKNFFENMHNTEEFDELI